MVYDKEVSTSQAWHKYKIQTHEPSIRSKVKKVINYNRQPKLVD